MSSFEAIPGPSRRVARRAVVRPGAASHGREMAVAPAARDFDISIEGAAALQGEAHLFSTFHRLVGEPEGGDAEEDEDEDEEGEPWLVASVEYGPFFGSAENVGHFWLDFAARGVR